MGMSNNIVKALVAQARASRNAISATFELLPVCNLDCKMCYIRTDMETVRRNGGLIPAEKWLELARQLQQTGVLFLLLTGGEAFLYPEFRYLYEQLVQMGFAITINTNGTLIDAETVEWLKQFPPKCISMSLYGASNETYEALCGRKGMFSRVDRAASMLHNAGIAIEFKTMLNPLNVHDMRACYEYSKSKDVPCEMATYAFPPSRKTAQDTQVRFTPEEAVAYHFEVNRLFSSDEAYDRNIVNYLNKYLTSSRKTGCQQYGFSCSAANTACWITWQGCMTGCGILNEPYTLPFQTGFAQAWAELKEKYDRIKLSTDCSFCDLRSVCTVCPASCYAESGRIDSRSDYHCRTTQLQLKQMEEYAREHDLTLEDSKP